MTGRYLPSKRRAMTLLEILFVVTILGILAAIVVPRFSNHSLDAKKTTCATRKGDIEVQCQLWLRQKNAVPAANLSDIGANTSYFPDGLPTCPVDGSSYSINTTTVRVNGHAH